MLTQGCLQESSGKPRSCSFSSSGSSCPAGFTCTVVGRSVASGPVTRCCGKHFGCPQNSAALVNPSTSSYVSCSLSSSTYPLSFKILNLFRTSFRDNGNKKRFYNRVIWAVRGFFGRESREQLWGEIVDYSCITLPKFFTYRGKFNTHS